ncbi:hypothetical protein CQS04_09225 [Chryseomicrobium excrementi]|uniref:Uncharacterized protein n=2 Tax=Chryseomicrobium excrementi TaxID=2041346 RepID=A0A2M9EY13_9BACL|nr:hypothetical protein CQS04_09225 [Chryseomicrobium excrementi]
MNYFMSMLACMVLMLTGCMNQGEEEHMKSQQRSLIQAVESNDIEKVQDILQDSSYQLNETNDKGQTPLLIATHKNYVEVAKLLIDAGADINQQDSIQDSPYLYAGAQGKTEILKYMIENAEPNHTVVNRYGGNALIPAAEKGHLENVKILLEDGKADIDHQNNFGYTALIEAVALTDGSELYQEIVQELLNYNANKELRDNRGKTALDYAKEMGYTEMVKLLED